MLSLPCVLALVVCVWPSANCIILDIFMYIIWYCKSDRSDYKMAKVFTDKQKCNNTKHFSAFVHVML